MGECLNGDFVSVCVCVGGGGGVCPFGAGIISGGTEEHG
jgi:hypothetical protein